MLNFGNRENIEFLNEETVSVELENLFLSMRGYKVFWVCTGEMILFSSILKNESHSLCYF